MKYSSLLFSVLLLGACGDDGGEGQSADVDTGSTDVLLEDAGTDSSDGGDGNDVGGSDAGDPDVTPDVPVDAGADGDTGEDVTPDAVEDTIDDADSDTTAPDTGDDAIDDAGDTTPPEVVSSDPADEATGVPPIGALFVTFSEFVTLGDVTLSQGGVPVAADVRLDRDLPMASVQPVLPLDYDTAYELRVESATDAAGNALAEPYVVRFTTSEGAWSAPVLVGGAGAPGTLDMAVAESGEAFAMMAGSRNISALYFNGRDWLLNIQRTEVSTRDGISATFGPDGVPLFFYPPEDSNLTIQGNAFDTTCSSNNCFILDTGATLFTETAQVNTARILGNGDEMMMLYVRNGSDTRDIMLRTTSGEVIEPWTGDATVVAQTEGGVENTSIELLSVVPGFAHAIVAGGDALTVLAIDLSDYSVTSEAIGVSPQATDGTEGIGFAGSGWGMAAVWVNTDESGGLNFALQDGTGWSVSDIPGSPRQASTPDVTIDEEGNLHVVYVDTELEHLFAVRYIAATGVWSDPVRLGDSTYLFPRIDGTLRGHALVLVTSNEPDNSGLFAFRFE
ncbi:MAG: hypothetical protein ACJA1R_001026 [Flavobacteriales bacterium]|jgi:hypothetical protein